MGWYQETCHKTGKVLFDSRTDGLTDDRKLRFQSLYRTLMEAETDGRELNQRMLEFEIYLRREQLEQNDYK